MSISDDWVTVEPQEVAEAVAAVEVGQPGEVVLHIKRSLPLFELRSVRSCAMPRQAVGRRRV